MVKEEKLSAKRQAVRRRLRRGSISPEEARETLGGKPLDEWDLDELARGRPRTASGDFRGQRPIWVTAEVEQEADRLLKRYLRGEMKSGALPAIRFIKGLLQDDTAGDRVRLDAAKFMVEHLLGRPSQEVALEASTSLESLLAGVLVNPDEQPAQGYIEAEVLHEEDVEDEDLEDLE